MKHVGAGIYSIMLMFVDRFHIYEVYLKAGYYYLIGVDFNPTKYESGIRK